MANPGGTGSNLHRGIIKIPCISEPTPKKETYDTIRLLIPFLLSYTHLDLAKIRPIPYTRLRSTLEKVT